MTLLSFYGYNNLHDVIILFKPNAKSIILDFDYKFVSHLIIHFEEHNSRYIV